VHRKKSTNFTDLKTRFITATKKVYINKHSTI